jgi:nucleoside-diphosphate-sugar epimerase
MNKKILITGTNGGLGSFLKRKFENPICITRENPLTDEIISEGVDTIIHCAFNQNMSELNLVNYKIYEDNINLTKKLLKIPHRRFVYISTCQVSELNSKSQPTPYIIMKALNEHIIREQSKNYLILRPSGLVGDDKKRNSLHKLMNNEDITLTGESVNDFILFDDVYNTIQSHESGTFYLLSQKSITMKEIAEKFNKEINFGNFKYEINVESDIDIGRTSFEILKEHFGEIE